MSSVRLLPSVSPDMIPHVASRVRFPNSLHFTRGAGNLTTYKLPHPPILTKVDIGHGQSGRIVLETGFESMLILKQVQCGGIFWSIWSPPVASQSLAISDMLIRVQ